MTSRTQVQTETSPADELATTLEGIIEEGKRTNAVIEEDATGSAGTPSLSRSPSLHSIITSVPSLHSGAWRYKGSSFSDDLKSDVPTIAESIADMQDFADLQIGGYSRATDDPIAMLQTRSLRPSGGSSNNGIMIDTRLHPLGVVNSPAYSSTMSESQGSGNPTIGDLGGISDVPSVRDDMSVASAPSEICVSFPPTICSETGSSSTTSRRLQGFSGCKSPGASKTSTPKIRIPRPRMSQNSSVTSTSAD